MKALGAQLYEGRVKGKRLGFYRPKIEEVRIRKAGDLEVTAHEIAHLLDDRIPEIRRQWNPATKENAEVRAELRIPPWAASVSSRALPSTFPVGCSLNRRAWLIACAPIKAVGHDSSSVSSWYCGHASRQQPQLMHSLSE